MFFTYGTELSPNARHNFKDSITRLLIPVLRTTLSGKKRASQGSKSRQILRSRGSLRSSETRLALWQILHWRRWEGQSYTARWCTWWRFFRNCQIVRFKKMTTTTIAWGLVSHMETVALTLFSISMASLPANIHPWRECVKRNRIYTTNYDTRDSKQVKVPFRLHREFNIVWMGRYTWQTGSNTSHLAVFVEASFGCTSGALGVVALCFFVFGSVSAKELWRENFWDMAMLFPHFSTPKHEINLLHEFRWQQSCGTLKLQNLS